MPNKTDSTSQTRSTTSHSTPAYLVCSSIMEKGHDSLEPYFQAVQPLLKKAGAELLVAGDSNQVLTPLEGIWPNKDAKFTLFKFPSMETLKAFWFSPEYQAIKHLRTQAIPPNFTFMVSGFDAETYQPH